MLAASEAGEDIDAAASAARGATLGKAVTTADDPPSVTHANGDPANDPINLEDFGSEPPASMQDGEGARADSPSLPSGGPL